MAAIRMVERRIITKEDAKKIGVPPELAKRRWEGGKARPGRPIKRERPGRRLRGAGKVVHFFQIVATTEAEARSGKFAQVGDLFVFIPAQAQEVIWEKINNIASPENRFLYYGKDFGIRFWLKKTGFTIPKFTYTERKTGDQKEKEWSPEYVVGFSKMVTIFDPKGKPVEAVAGVYQQKQTLPVHNWIMDIWLKRVIHGKRAFQTGLFHSKKQLSFVAAAYDITLNMKATSKDWYRSAAPINVQTEAEQHFEIAEEAYDVYRDAAFEYVRLMFSQGQTPEIDWEQFQAHLRPHAGAISARLIARLKADVDKEIERLRQGGQSYTSNRPFRAPSKRLMYSLYHSGAFR